MSSEMTEPVVPISAEDVTIQGKAVTLFFFFYKNLFYKNIEAEICEILRVFQEYTRG